MKAKKRVLVTGGAGFIGSHLVELLVETHSVVVLDDLSSGDSSNLSGVKCRLINGSILDKELLRDAVDSCDLVFHLAGMTSVAKANAHPSDCVNENLMGLISVLEASVRSGVSKIIFASSSAVYGSSEARAHSEVDRPLPESVYGMSKLAGENLLRSFQVAHGLLGTSLRLFNVYGPRQNPEGDYASVIPKFVKLAQNDQSLVIHGDGEQTRDFIHVADVAMAFHEAAKSENCPPVMNVGTGTGCSVLQLAREIVGVTGSSSQLVYHDPRKGDVRDSLADTTLLNRFGMNPQVELKKRLEEMCRGGDSPASSQS